MTLNRTQTNRTDREVEAPTAAVQTSVLFVDDDSEFAALVADYLETTHGFEVRTETNPEDALGRIESNDDLSCVVSDYAMPEMDGLEFLEAVKARRPNLPFVLFAGQGSEQVASRAIRLGADDYLEKDTGETRYELLATRISNCVTISRQQQKLQNIYAAIEHAGHAMLVTDVDGTITYANPSMEEITGYDLAELRGESPSLLSSDEHDDAFYRDLWETILNGEVWEGEVINERKNGDLYVIEQTISPIREGGEISGFVAINHDVTERKRRERERAFFQQAVEQVGTGIAAYDSAGRITYVNQAYAGMLGTSQEGLEGKHIATVNPEFDESSFDEYWDSFGPGETRRREGVNRRFDDGSTFPVDTVTTHIEINDEEYHIGTIQDITERKERERELQMFQQAVEEAGHSVIVTDADGTIEYVNPAFEELTGFDREKAIGKTPSLLKSGEHDEEFYDRLWETILEGGVWEGEIINERKSGEQCVVDQTIAPITEDGEITGFVSINRDVTELKEQEQELKRQNERLERFGRTVAHDLRNPLNVMDSHLSMARHADDPDDAHDEIRQAIDRMSELIDELLALAKHGTSVLDPEPVSLAAVATTAWDHVDTAAMCLDCADDAELLMDDARVRELFENLYRNAREHAGVDAAVRVGTLSDGFYVEDDGPGIPDNKRDDVLTSGFTTSEEGTGFGLAIVSQIADAHDWEVIVTEGSDGGARFEFHDAERVDV